MRFFASLGTSDRATLTLIECWDKVKVYDMNMFSSGEYSALVIDETVDVPAHYELEHEFEKKVRIYDDNGFAKEFTANKIRFYRDDIFGIIIQLVNPQKD